MENDEWSMPIYFTHTGIFAADGDELSVVFAPRELYDIEVLAVEAHNNTGLRGTVHGYLDNGPGQQPGYAIFNGIMQDEGGGSEGVFLWQGRAPCKGRLNVAFFGATAGDVLVLYGVYRMRPRGKR